MSDNNLYLSCFLYWKEHLTYITYTIGKCGRYIARAGCLLALIFLCENCAGQDKAITGKVSDSLTHAPLQNVTVRIKGTSRGTLTDSTGAFRLTADKNAKQVTFSLVGYAPKSISLGESLNPRLIVLMSETYTTLEGITVKFRKGKYRNKNNPAVDLIREVIRHRPYNTLSAYPFATFRKYDKTLLSMDNLPHWITEAGLIHKYHFLFENIDTTKVPGKRLIPLYITEALSQEYYRAHPEKKKTIVLGQKSVDYGEFIDVKGIGSLLSNMYGEIDLYNNSIDLFGTQLLSPISEAAPTFYMYFIMDTTVQNGVPTVKVAYMPRNPDDLLFRGTLFIPLDGHYAVAKADLGISKHINLNFVRSFKINLDYKKDSLGHYYLSGSDMMADLGVFQKDLGMFGERVISNTGFRTDSTVPDSLFRGLPEDSAVNASHPPDSLWNTARSIPLTPEEARVYKNIDSLRGMRSFHRLMDIGTMLTVGYKQAGIFNIGPVGTFYSYNPIEGFRPQFGGRTTPKLSKSIYGETFVAYGLHDHQWKYGLDLSYSFNHRSIFNYFPLHYLQAGYQRDTRIPGQINSFSSANSVFNSFTQGPNNQWLYNNIFHVDYLKEFLSHFSYDLGYQYWRQEPAGSLQYLYKTPTGLFDTVRQVTTSIFTATLRWAPHEQFFQNQLGRFDIATHYPIITFSYSRGVKGLLGGQYNYDALHLNIYRRFFLAPFGFTDVTFDAGYLADKLPFPLLYIHPANESYLYFYNSYNLMNFEEFVSDHFAGLNFDHYFNGFFFNKVPWLKWLKLREVVAAKILYGGVRDENNPAKNPAQLRFPSIGGVTSTYVLNGLPYIEASVGVFNIFKILRIDLVRRMTYLEHPYISPWGIRFSTMTNF